MEMEFRIRERHKRHLCSLLNIKKANQESTVNGLQEELEKAVVVMEQGDIAWVEKIIGVKAL